MIAGNTTLASRPYTLLTINRLLKLYIVMYDKWCNDDDDDDDDVVVVVVASSGSYRASYLAFRAFKSRIASAGDMC